MIIKRLNARGVEVVKTQFKVAESGGSVTANSPVNLLCDGNSIDGLSAGQPATVNLGGFIGISERSVAINGYGLAISWGYTASVKISNAVDSITITAGDALIPIAGTDLGMSSVSAAVAGWANQACVIALETKGHSAGQYYMKGLVRALR